jgi:hypothetical protein
LPNGRHLWLFHHNADVPGSEDYQVPQLNDWRYVDRMKSMLVALSIVVATHLAFRPAAAQELEPLAMSYLPGNAIAWDLDVAMEKGFFKGVLPPGTTISPRDYMLPRELGGLYR